MEPVPSKLQKSAKELRWLMPLATRLALSLSGPPEATIVRDDGEEVPNPAYEEGLVAEDLEQVASELFDFLEGQQKNPGFESAVELLVWATDVTDYLSSREALEYKALAPELAVMLQGPLGRYQVRVEFQEPKRRANQFQFTGEFHLPGVYSLKVSPLRGNGQSGGFVLHGVVHAGTWDGARWRAETLVDEFCGALRCLGLCEFVSIHHWGVSLSSEPDAFAAAVRIAGGQVDRQDGGLFHDLVGEAIGLDPGMSTRLYGTRLLHPPDLSDLDRHHAKAGQLDRALARHVRALERVFWHATERGRQLRAACRRIVMAELSRDVGLATTLAFSCLEGLLLDPKSKSETTGRLTEAVAHSLGSTFDERNALRAKVKDLYELRSGFVHTGAAPLSARGKSEVLELALRVIRREMEMLPEPPSTWKDLAKQ